MTKRFNTLKDVAKEAGVAPITVSRVVNSTSYVNKETREKIIKAIEKLHYQPSVSARKLKMLKSNVISIIVPDIKNNFYANIIESAEDIIRNNGLDVMIFNSRYSIKLEMKFLEISLSNRVDGIIINNLGGNRKLLNNILNVNKIPMVFIGAYFKDISADFIIHQNFEGVYLLTEHLIKKHHHKKIGYISRNLMDDTAIDRFNGYKKALLDNKIELDKNLVLYGEANIENGYNLTKSLVLKNKNISALVCMSTIFGIGAVKVLKDLKLEIPNDIAIVTFDDYDINSILTPSLTTLRRVDKMFGEEAANLILEKIRKKKIKGGRIIKIPSELLVRESCGCL